MGVLENGQTYLVVFTYRHVSHLDCNLLIRLTLSYSMALSLRRCLPVDSLDLEWNTGLFFFFLPITSAYFLEHPLPAKKC